MIAHSTGPSGAPTSSWLADFDAELSSHYGIDHIDAGMDPEQIRRYADLDPKQAAHAYANDYDLDRITGWG